MLQVVSLALMTTLAAVCSVDSCPIPGDGCTSLPQDDFSYDEYLDNLPTSDYMLQLNASRADDLAFNPNAVSSYMATASPAEIRAGCSGWNFNFSILEGASRVLDITCPFTFVCDYNPQRVPAHIFHARCSSRQLSNGIKCREVFYPVVTMTTESCDPLTGEEGWLLKTELVATSCIAAR